MHRFALGLIAAVAVTSLDAGAQTGAVDTPRLSTFFAAPQTSSRLASSDTTAGGPASRAVAPASHHTARTAGAPRSAPTLARRSGQSPDDSPFAPQTAKERRGMKYMLIGAGVLITGAIIDDDAGDILMVGGVVISFYGLWIFLN